MKRTADYERFSPVSPGRWWPRCSAVRFFDEMASFMPTGTLESFRDDLDLTYTQAGAVLIAIAPGAFVGNAASIAADFTSRRLIIVAGALGYAGVDAGVRRRRLVPGAARRRLARRRGVDGDGRRERGGARRRRRQSPARAPRPREPAGLRRRPPRTGHPVRRRRLRASAGGRRSCVDAVMLVAYAAVLACTRCRRGDGADAPRARSAPSARCSEIRRCGCSAGCRSSLNPLDETVFAFGIAFLQEDRGLVGVGRRARRRRSPTVGGIGALLLAPRSRATHDDRLLVASGIGLAASVAAFAVLPGTAGDRAAAGRRRRRRDRVDGPAAPGADASAGSGGHDRGGASRRSPRSSWRAPLAIGVIVDAFGLRPGIATFASLPVGFAAVARLGHPPVAARGFRTVAERCGGPPTSAG